MIDKRWVGIGMIMFSFLIFDYVTSDMMKYALAGLAAVLFYIGVELYIGEPK